MHRLLGILLCLVCLSVPGWAASARAEGATVVVNEVAVLTLKTTIGGTSPAGRAKILAGRLNQQEYLNLTVTTQDAASKIYSNGELILAISKEEASRAGTSAASLAQKWSQSLTAAWNLPSVKVDQHSYSLPVGGTQAIAVVGSKARVAPIFVPSSGPITVRRKGATVTVKAVALGDASIRIGDDENAETITVRVLPSAMSFPQSVNAAVLGSPASAGVVQGAIEMAVRSKLKMRPDTQVTFTAPNPSELGAGEQKTFTLKVAASAPDAFSTAGQVTVTVTNLALGTRREQELWYCNDPENVPGPRSLFLAVLRQEVPIRMLYHHINISSSPLYFRVLAINDNDQPANLAIIPGDSKDKNPVLAGVMAADPFFRGWLSGSAEVLTLPPHTSVPIAFRRLAPQETSSGLCYLRLLPGGPANLQVSAEALSPYSIDSQWQAALLTPTPYRQTGAGPEAPMFPAMLSKTIYPNPLLQEEFTYRVGGPFGFYRVGQVPIERLDPGKPLDGNFGVTYLIAAKAENPSADPVTVELVYETSAGYSGGLFSVDGNIVRLPLMQSKAEAKLATFTLGPGESKTINVITIPLSGSSYPVTLALRPVTRIADIK